MLWWNLSKGCTICENCPVDYLKADKSKGLQKQFLSYLQFCAFSLYFKFGLKIFFLSTGTRKGTNMFNVRTNLRKFHRKKRDKFYSKDHCFLCRKTLRNGIKLRQDRYLSMRRLSNPSHLAIFPTAVFSFRLTSFSGVEGLWILRVQLLETLYSTTLKTV